MLQTAFPVDMSPALGSETECAERFELACERAGVPCEFPTPTEIGASILRDGLFYDLDATWLRNLASTGGIAGVTEDRGRFVWSAVALSHAGCLAETFRRFQPHPAHLPKLSAPELAQAQAEAEGQQLFNDLEHAATRDIVWMLAQSQDLCVRQTFAVALLAKLKAMGVADR